VQYVPTDKINANFDQLRHITNDKWPLNTFVRECM